MELFIAELPDDCVWLVEVLFERYASPDIVHDICLIDHVHIDLIGLPFVGIHI